MTQGSDEGMTMTEAKTWVAMADGKFTRVRPDGGRNVYGWLEVEDNLNALEAKVALLTEARDALAEYQRLSNVGRPSAVVDGADMLNERYRDLLARIQALTP